MVKVLGDSRRQALRELFGPIGRRPHLHVREHARVQLWNWNRGIEVRAIRGPVRGSRIDHVAGHEAAARIVVRNEGDVAESQRVPEAFVVAEKEHLVFLDGPAQRTAELISPEGRDSRVCRLRLDVKEIPRIRGAVA